MVRETFQKERDGGEDLPDKERDILRRREERHFLKREREGGGDIPEKDLYILRRWEEMIL